METPGPFSFRVVDATGCRRGERAYLDLMVTIRILLLAALGLPMLTVPAQALTCVTDIVGVTRCTESRGVTLAPVGPDRNADGNRMTTDGLGITQRTDDAPTVTDGLGIVQPNPANRAMRGLAVQQRPAPGTRCSTDSLGITQCY